MSTTFDSPEIDRGFRLSSTEHSRSPPLVLDSGYHLSFEQKQSKSLILTNNVISAHSSWQLKNLGKFKKIVKPLAGTRKRLELSFLSTCSFLFF